MERAGSRRGGGFQDALGSLKGVTDRMRRVCPSPLQPAALRYHTLYQFRSRISPIRYWSGFIAAGTQKSDTPAGRKIQGGGDRGGSPRFTPRCFPSRQIIRNHRHTRIYKGKPASKCCQ